MNTKLFIPLIKWRFNDESEYYVKNIGIFTSMSLTLHSLCKYFVHKEYITKLPDTRLSSIFELREYMYNNANDDYFTNCEFEIVERTIDLEYLSLESDE